MDVYKMVQEDIPNISLGTVYRNLKQLEAHHLIQTIRDKGVLRFDSDLSDHQHFLCDSCQQIYDLSLPVLDFVQSIEKKMGHKITGYELRLTGICQNCLETYNEE